MATGLSAPPVDLIRTSVDFSLKKNPAAEDWWLLIVKFCFEKLRDSVSLINFIEFISGCFKNNNWLKLNLCKRRIYKVSYTCFTDK